MKQEYETEAKIEISDKEYEKFRELFESGNEFLQINKFYKFGEKVVRVREEKGKQIVCIKGKLQNGKYNVRKEDEFYFNGKGFFELLGMKHFLEYEKRRIEFEHEGCVICLDRIGESRFYLEVEGDEEKIEKILRKLGLIEREIERRAYFEILN